MAYTQEQINAALAEELALRPGTSYEDMLAYATDAYGLSPDQVQNAFMALPDGVSQGEQLNAWQDMYDSSTDPIISGLFQRSLTNEAINNRTDLTNDERNQLRNIEIYYNDPGSMESDAGLIADYANRQGLNAGDIARLTAISPEEVNAYLALSPTPVAPAPAPVSAPVAAPVPVRAAAPILTAAPLPQPIVPPPMQMPRPIVPSPAPAAGNQLTNAGGFTYGAPTEETGGWNNRFTQLPQTIGDRATQALAEELAQRPGSSYNALRAQALRLPGVTPGVFDEAYANVAGKRPDYSSGLIQSLRQASPPSVGGNTGVSIIPNLTSRTPVDFTTTAGNAFNPPRLQSPTAPGMNEQDFLGNQIGRTQVPESGWTLDQATQALTNELSMRPGSTYDALRVQALRYPGMNVGLFNQAYQNVTGATNLPGGTTNNTGATYAEF